MNNLQKTNFENTAKFLNLKRADDIHLSIHDLKYSNNILLRQTGYFMFG